MAAMEEEVAMAGGGVDEERLRSIMEQYQNALEELRAMASQISSQNHPHGEKPKSYNRLKATAEASSFLERIGGVSESSISDTLRDDQGSWDLITESDLGGSPNGQDCLDHDNYVVVNQEEIVEALACFMARCVSSLPQTKEMTPKQIQDALKKAFASKKGRLHKLWDGGKSFYSAASFGATAVSMYNNPALTQAMTVAFQASLQFITKLL